MHKLPVNNKYFWPVLWAVVLHAALFALLFVSFSSTPDLPPSRPAVKATLYQLESKNRATTQTPQKIAGEAEKTAAQQYEREQLEQKKREQQQAAAKRQAEQERQAAAKKAAEQKRAEEQKRVAEQKAAEQRKLEQQKAEAAKKLAAEKARAEQERKEAERKKAEELKRQQELAEKRKKEAEAAAARLAADKAREAQRKAEEERAAAALAELLQQETQYQRDMADQQAQNDVARIDDLIVQLIRSNWIRPATARNGMRVDLLVEILADGTIRRAQISKSSGDAAFDNSAVAAVLSVGRIREIQSLDRASYEKIYRQRIMSFRPEDLSL